MIVFQQGELKIEEFLTFDIYILNVMSFSNNTIG